MGKEKAVYDWGQNQSLAPSIKRIDPWGWIGASLVGGSCFALVALVLVWKPWFGTAIPPGALPEHLEYWWKLAVNGLWHSAFKTDARIYRDAFAAWSDAQRIGMVWRCACAVWVFLMTCVMLAGPYLRPRDGLIHLRGSTRHEGAEAVAHINQSLKARVKRRPDHEIAPGVAYPADLWTRHVLVVGGTGSGKSTAIKPLIDKVVASGEQMLLFDPKSEFTEGFAKPAIIAPWDSRSLSWDIAKDMRNPLDMRRFAATVIRESQDPMWSNASRQLLVGLMIYLRATLGTDWGWVDLKELVSQPQTVLLSIMRDWHPEAVRSVEKASVTTAGILINLSSFCSAIFDLAESWGDVPKHRRVSFVEWTQGRSKYPQIILQGHGAYTELTKAYVEGIVGIVSAIVNSVEMRDDPNRKIWFIADEFAQMGKIPVRPLFEVGRSRGVRCVIACQDFAQLEELYGAPMVKALIGMCGTLLIGQIMQGETAEQLCKAFGAREVERTNMSSSFGGASAGPNRSVTLSYNRDEVALYKPSELSSRLGLTPDGTGVTLLLFTGGHAYELVWPHYTTRSERVAYKAAPWTLGANLSAPHQVADAAPSLRVDREVRDERDANVDSGSMVGMGTPRISDESEARKGADPSNQFATATTNAADGIRDGVGDSRSGGDVKSGAEGGAAKRLHANDLAEGKPGTDAKHEPGSRQAQPVGAQSVEADSAKGKAITQSQCFAVPEVLASLTMPEAPEVHVEVRTIHVSGDLVAGSMMAEEAQPMSEGVIDLALHKAGIEALSVALMLSNVAGQASDARPGPRQEVMMNVASPPAFEPGKEVRIASRKP